MPITSVTQCRCAWLTARRRTKHCCREAPPSSQRRTTGAAKYDASCAIPTGTWWSLASPQVADRPDRPGALLRPSASDNPSGHRQATMPPKPSGPCRFIGALTQRKRADDDGLLLQPSRRRTGHLALKRYRGGVFALVAV